MEAQLAEFRHHLIRMLDEPSGLPMAGEDAARELAGKLRDGTPGPGRTGSGNPLGDEMRNSDAFAGASDARIGPLYESFAAIADALPWYRRPEPDLPDFEAGHANADIIGVNGLQVQKDIRVGATLMRPNVTYPDHHHPPEEVYVVLSEGLWRQNDEPWWSPGPGGYVYNPPHILHAMKSVDTPLLAIWCLN